MSESEQLDEEEQRFLSAAETWALVEEEEEEATAGEKSEVAERRAELQLASCVLLSSATRKSWQESLMPDSGM